MEYIYAALLLHKVGKEVNEENMKKVVEASGAELGSDGEAKMKSLIASLQGVDIEKELESANLAVSAGTTSAAPSEEAPKEEKKEEEEEKKEGAAEGLSALFG